MVCSSISIVIVRLKCTIPGVLVLDVMDRKMGDKYTTRSGIAKGPLSTARLKILVPFCLMVFVAWNSSSMVPFGRSSSGPTYGMPVPEYESLGVNTMQRHKKSSGALDGLVDVGLARFHPRTDVVTNQFDISMTFKPTSQVHDEPNSVHPSINNGAQFKIEITSDEEDKVVIAQSKYDEGGREHDSTQSKDCRKEDSGAIAQHGADGNAQTTAESNQPDRNEGSSVAPDTITGNLSSPVNIAAMEIFDEIRSRSLPYATTISERSEDSCQGKYVYVYDLPPEFNVHLTERCDSMIPWFNLCDFFADSGIGKPVNSMDNGTQIFLPADRWFSTHQYALELVSHARIMKYKCRTEDPNLANLFYIPYYGGLDVIRWHFDLNATNTNRDALGWKLVRWLEKQPSWRRRGGLDHLLVLGKISWDFRRQLRGNWGSRLLEFPEIQNMMRVMIERNPWSKNDIGVPHPTYFHPKSASDIDTWLQHVKSQERTSLVAFVGKERRNDPTNVRSALVRQCRGASSEAVCRFVECKKDLCQHPVFVTKTFVTSQFCMQPVGDSPTRRSVFDSLIAGCIPVLFHPATAYLQYAWHLPRNESSWSVYISEDEVREGRVNAVDVLKKISTAEMDAMRETILNTVIPGLLYSAPGSDVSPYKDAFDITIEQLLHHTAHLPDSEEFAKV
ncbi:probable xyloglucan galactosyltransferase GT20 [Physcomitrium patens]|uniref:Exostosin GT47 domain-containing protein n=1 Tax=Physcomitrium patens TaxID=3218 RepID=A0A2K1JHG3_PHYPA|nr:probable xyloglucan galactosyltransferase GT20 [Physcomitrium patens]XP_024394534.1 probable xyloglucan galactosyltransferase GT20 [Physcomitrium patens]PNR40995.1 hypothetical protein PHYPA_018398 [Physcomitrium patens]|eukprot:XP_024394533.1 probable xyloglucan galactosyltransferase GT20 [Physcomitrella patens]